MKKQLTLLTLLATGCYHAQPIDTRAMLDEVRLEQRAFDREPRAPRPEEGAPDGRALATEEAVELALRWNPELRVLRRQQGVAEGEIIAAGALANPTVELQLLHVQQVRAAPLDWSVKLQWEPPSPLPWPRNAPPPGPTRTRSTPTSPSANGSSPPRSGRLTPV